MSPSQCSTYPRTPSLHLPLLQLIIETKQLEKRRSVSVMFKCCCKSFAFYAHFVLICTKSRKMAVWGYCGCAGVITYAYGLSRLIEDHSRLILANFAKIAFRVPRQLSPQKFQSPEDFGKSPEDFSERTQYGFWRVSVWISTNWFEFSEIIGNSARHCAPPDELSEMCW